MQTKLRKEIRETLKKDGTISYDMIATNLPYLNAAIKETLRLYPILPFLDRVCEISGKGYSLEPYSSFKIPNGMPVYIPIYDLQRDAEVQFVVGVLFSCDRNCKANPFSISPNRQSLILTDSTRKMEQQAIFFGCRSVPVRGTVLVNALHICKWKWL